MMQSIVHFLSTPRITIFAATWGTFIAGVFISLGWQVFHNRKSLTFWSIVDTAFPLEGWATRSAKIDVFMFCITAVTKRIYGVLSLFISGALAIVVQNLLSSGFPHDTPASFGFYTVLFCSIGIFVLRDFVAYAMHVLNHSVPMLWEFHKVHHSATFLNPATSDRFHPLETIMLQVTNAAIEGFSVGFLAFYFGFDKPEIIILMANVRTISYIAVFERLKHTQFPLSLGPLDAVLYSPRMHQLHHSTQAEHIGKNLGDKLSIWDRMFGTIFIEEKVATLNYGLGCAEDRDFESLHGVYVAPFAKAIHLLKGQDVGVSSPAPLNAEVHDTMVYAQPSKLQM